MESGGPLTKYEKPSKWIDLAENYWEKNLIKIISRITVRFTDRKWTVCHSACHRIDCCRKHLFHIFAFSLEHCASNLCINKHFGTVQVLRLNVSVKLHLLPNQIRVDEIPHPFAAAALALKSFMCVDFLFPVHTVAIKFTDILYWLGQIFLVHAWCTPTQLIPPKIGR